MSDVVSGDFCCFKLALPSLLFMLKDEIKAAHSDFNHCSRGGGLRLENPSDRHFSQLYFSNAVWRNNRPFEYESDLRSNKHYLSSSENKACKKFRLVGDLNPWPLLHRYRRGHGFKSRTSLNLFFRPIFTPAQVVFITAKIAFIFKRPIVASHSVTIEYSIVIFKH